MKRHTDSGKRVVGAGPIKPGRIRAVVRLCANRSCREAGTMREQTAHSTERREQVSETQREREDLRVAALVPEGVSALNSRPSEELRL